jgi:hypothetical protein
MSFRGTFSAASYRGFQAGVTGLQQVQVISNNYIYIGAVSSDGDYFAIRRESSAGTFDIYYYDGTEFTLQQTISIGATVQSLAINETGEYLIAGITNSPSTGYANIYLRTGTSWALQQTITPSDSPQTQFGISVAITSDASRVVVGNPNSATDTNQYGSFYVFSRSGTTWTQETKKQLSTLVSYDRLGTSVSIDDLGNNIVAGAPSVFDTTGTTGKTVTFTRSGTTWTQQQIILRPTGANGRSWGQEVKISGTGDYIAGVCPDTGASGIFGGIGMYYYNVSTWTQQNYFTTPYGSALYFYPGSIALTNNADYMFTAGDEGQNEFTKGMVYPRSGTSFVLSQILDLVSPNTVTFGEPNIGRVIGTNSDGTVVIYLGFLNSVPNEVYIFRKS